MEIGRLYTPGPRIKCTGCGKHAPEAGFAVSHADISRGGRLNMTEGDYEEGGGVNEDADMHPLCEACLTAMERTK